MRKGLDAPQVGLHPDDEDWECTCARRRSREHVVAAVIAMRRAKKDGEELPTQGEGRGRVVYEIENRDGHLWLTRNIEYQSKRTVLRGSLTAADATLFQWPRRRDPSGPRRGSAALLATGRRHLAAERGQPDREARRLRR